jgi:hypothetical protein
MMMAALYPIAVNLSMVRPCSPQGWLRLVSFVLEALVDLLVLMDVFQLTLDLLEALLDAVVLEVLG